MATFKQFILFLFIEILLFPVLLFLYNGRFTSAILNPYMYILPGISTLLGLIIGVVTYELKLRPISKKFKIHTIGYIIGFFCLILFLVFSYYSAEKPDEFPNMTDNRSVMKNWVGENEEYIQIAFNKLEAEFTHPNDFKITSFFVRKRDSLYNNITDTLYNIYFTYYLEGNKPIKLFSKISVFQSVPTLRLFNADTKENLEYIEVIQQNEKQEKEMMQSFKKSLLELPESTRKQILDTIRQALDQ